MSDKVSVDHYADLNPPRHIPDEIRSDSLVNFIPMSDVSEAGHWSIRQLRKFGEVSSGFTNFKSNDVLVAKITPCFENGKGAIVKGLVNGIGFGSTEFHVLRAKNGVSPEFVSHIAQWPTFRKEAQRYMIGSAGQQRVQRLAFSRCKLGVFDGTEQKTIANILDTLDTQIRQTEAIIAKLQQVKQGLLHDLLTRGIDANGQLRSPRDQAPELYKESPLGWIPREWDYGTLSTKAVPGEAHIKTGPFGSALKGEHWVKEGCPVITIGSLGVGDFLYSELLFISKRDEVRLSDYALKRGEIVFSRVADVGRSVVIKQEQHGWIMSSNLMKISLDQTLVSPQFLQYQLSHPQIAKQQIRRTVNSAGRDVANSSTLNQLLFLWPTKDEQDRIVYRIELMDRRTHKEADSLNKLKKQKSGLMDDLLTGRVRVTSLLDTAKAS